LNVPEAEGVKVTIENGITTIVAEGAGAHGSTPEKGINAAIRLFQAVKDIRFTGDFQKMVNFVLNNLVGETNGETLGIRYFDAETGETTVNLGVLNYDGKTMTFTLDIRYPQNAVPEEVTKNVTAAAEKEGLDILRCAVTPVLYVPKDSELVQKLCKVFKEHSGMDLEPLAIGGGTYAKAFKNMVAFGPGFPGKEYGCHEADECVEIDEMIKSCQIVTSAMYEMAQK